MKITLMGMSNIGKTYWSKKLEQRGFTRFSCDDYIGRKLLHKLQKLGYSGIEGIAKWLGQPYDSQHKDHSRQYLELERESLEYILDRLENIQTKNVVIDTTASAIYIGEMIMRRLGQETKIVYLDTPNLVKRHMYRSYLENPKPVIWGDVYKKMDGESPLEALERCYPKLLDYRTKQYKKYAYLSLNYFLLRSQNFTVDNFLNLLLDVEEKI